jgi:hypothetical protein
VSSTIKELVAFHQDLSKQTSVLGSPKQKYLPLAITIMANLEAAEYANSYYEKKYPNYPPIEDSGASPEERVVMADSLPAATGIWLLINEIQKKQPSTNSQEVDNTATPFAQPKTTTTIQQWTKANVSAQALSDSVQREIAGLGVETVQNTDAGEQEVGAKTKDSLNPDVTPDDQKGFWESYNISKYPKGSDSETDEPRNLSVKDLTIKKQGSDGQLDANPIASTKVEPSPATPLGSTNSPGHNASAFFSPSRTPASKGDPTTTLHLNPHAPNPEKTLTDPESTAELTRQSVSKQWFSFDDFTDHILYQRGGEGVKCFQQLLEDEHIRIADIDYTDWKPAQKDPISNTSSKISGYKVISDDNGINVTRITTNDTKEANLQEIMSQITSFMMSDTYLNRCSGQAISLSIRFSDKVSDKQKCSERIQAVLNVKQLANSLQNIPIQLRFPQLEPASAPPPTTPVELNQPPRDNSAVQTADTDTEPPSPNRQFSM